MKSRQQELPLEAGGAGRGRHWHNLFFAVFPDPEAAARIASLARNLRAEHGLKGRALARERLHVSLHHVDGYGEPPTDAVIAAARAAASAVRAPPFAVAFNAAVGFRGKTAGRPLVLRGDDGVVGLLTLRQMLGAALAEAGPGRRPPPYLPHLTLLYGDPLEAEQPVKPVGWTVREFVLVQSLLGQGRYVPLGRFALRG